MVEYNVYLEAVKLLWTYVHACYLNAWMHVT